MQTTTPPLGDDLDDRDPGEPGSILVDWSLLWIACLGVVQLSLFFVATIAIDLPKSPEGMFALLAAVGVMSLCAMVGLEWLERRARHAWHQARAQRVYASWWHRQSARIRASAKAIGRSDMAAADIGRWSRQSRAGSPALPVQATRRDVGPGGCQE